MAKTAKDKQLKSWQDVDKALARYSKLTANAAFLTAALNDQNSQLKELTEQITAFAESHIADLGANKLKNLEYGQISLRQSTSVRVADEDATLEYLQRNRLESCYKPAFKLVKSALKALGPDTQAAAGVEIVTEEKVSLKPIPQSPNCSLQFV